MSFTRIKKNRFALILAFVMVFNFSFAMLGSSADAVTSSQINALKNQQSQLAQKKAAIQTQAQALNGQVADQTQKLNILAQQLDVTNQELDNLSKQIAAYTDSIAQLQNELNIDQQKEDALLAQYGKRMRAMEENGNSSYIAIIFGASDFEDLLSRISDVKEIMQYDTDLINEVREAKAKVETAKSAMESEMATQEEVFQQYQDKQADLLTQQAEVKEVLSSLQESSADYASQLQSVNALSASISGQISNMEAELEEQKRLQAEQAAAAKIAANNKGTTTNTNTNKPSTSGSTGGTGNKWTNDTTVSGGSGQDIVNYAESFLGVPYVYGGTSPSGFDCSGLIYYCYRHYGYAVNRTAASLAYNGTPVTSLRAGDVLLFTSVDGSYIGHCGIYIGGGQFIHAPHTGDVVKISNLSDSYYTSHYVGARRIIS